jgi:hypothetical protein
MRWPIIGMVLAVLAYVILTSPRWNRPSPAPRAEVGRDTVWLGCTWVETKDGKVIVKYERVKNPVLWDSVKETK